MGGGGCQNSGVYKGFDFSQVGEFRAWDMVAEHPIAVLARDAISLVRSCRRALGIVEASACMLDFK